MLETLTGRRIVLFIIIILLNISGFLSRTSDTLKIKLSHGGGLLGRHLTSHNGRHIRAFMGIPYALPPLGDLRFKPPVPYGPWTGEKLADEDSPKCTQRDPFRRDMEIEGSEDCLYLNVYTPETPYANMHRLPVMVWFHGGGWQCGSGISSFYGPDYLMDFDIILVSANFRLGPLGFLSTETLDCPGNFGLKDQVEVLKWVKHNIEAFGGDPNNVTLFGESAGGASLTYHMVSEKSKGLFHKGIAQSGTYFNPWAQPAHKGIAAQRARKISKLLNCDFDNWQDSLQCLRNRSAHDIQSTFYELFEWDFDPMIPFPPVVEVQHKDAFLTTAPRDISNPHGLELPLIIGLTADEGVMKTAPLLNLPNLLEEFKSKFKEVIPIILNYDHHSQDTQDSITSKIEKFYLKNSHNYDKNNHQNLTNMISDGWFVAGIDEYLRLRLRKNGLVGPTYVYLFNHKGAASFSEIFKGGEEEYYGVCHAEELQYLFPVGKVLFKRASPTVKDIEVRNTMLRMWVNFAYTSNPTPSDEKLNTWPKSDNYPVQYAIIGSKDENSIRLFQTSEGLFQERVDFWYNLKAHWPAPNSKDEL